MINNITCILYFGYLQTAYFQVLYDLSKEKSDIVQSANIDLISPKKNNTIPTKTPPKKRLSPSSTNSSGNKSISDFMKTSPKKRSSENDDISRS